MISAPAGVMPPIWSEQTASAGQEEMLVHRMPHSPESVWPYLLKMRVLKETFSLGLSSVFYSRMTSSQAFLQLKKPQRSLGVWSRSDLRVLSGETENGGPVSCPNGYRLKEAGA